MSSFRGTEPKMLVRALVEVLDAQVLPAITQREARSALHLVLGLLDNLGTRIEEAGAPIRAEQVALGRVRAALPDDLEAELNVLEASDGGPGATSFGPLLRAVRRRLALLDDEAGDVWLAMCRGELARLSEDEMSRMRPTRYLTSQR